MIICDDDEMREKWKRTVVEGRIDSRVGYLICKIVSDAVSR